MGSVWLLRVISREMIALMSSLPYDHVYKVFNFSNNYIIQHNYLHKFKALLRNTIVKGSLH